ncbi:putative multidrug resistance protein fnx1 [Xylariaceae sp. FL1272]|nr:putative multidrug resistance protein fnx1 [Xylariaceae sp. FL1272]
MIFLVQTEIFIVTTSLVAIAKDLGQFDKTSWVLASYFLGYVSFVVIVSKLSDIFGRKPVYVLSIVTFTLFSGACGAAQTMPQLIILRAFQGVGGGGSYALASILTIETVPPHRYATQMTYIGLAVTLALIVGPIAGGGISSVTTWRWIFLFNVPVGVVGLGLAVTAIPSGFPHRQGGAQLDDVSKRRRAFAKLDIPGCFLILLATLSVVSAFQEGGSRFPWRSPYFIALTAGSTALWITLVIWERRRFLTSRAMVGTLLGIFLQGGPLTVTNLQIPQRFQLVNGLSSLNAGIRFIPFGVALSAGTILSANAAKRFKIPAVYCVLCGALTQILGFSLLGTSGFSDNIPGRLYAYLVIAGLGCGVSFQILILAVPAVTEKRDNAVGLGTANQFRAIGSSVLVAVTTAVFNGYVYPQLLGLGISNPDTVIEAYSEARRNVAPEVWDEARRSLSKGYDRQMLVLVASAAAQIFAALLLWKKIQIRVA